jgi:hypothetical protein
MRREGAADNIAPALPRVEQHMSVAEVIDPPKPKLPSARSEAPLPVTYTDAKAALERCERVDECAEWADRAGALASYARQARDTELEAMAKRMRARAVRRAGELLQEIPTCRGRRRDLFPDRPAGARTEQARRAGMSASQQKTAIRLAKIPTQDFEAAVEAADPPGTMRLAGRAALRPPPLNTDGDGGFERARGLLHAARRLPLGTAGGTSESPGHGAAQLWRHRCWGGSPDAGAPEATSLCTRSRIGAQVRAGAQRLRGLPAAASFAPVQPASAYRHPCAEEQDNDHKRDVGTLAQSSAATAVLAGLFVRPTRLAFDPIGDSVEIAG